MNTTKFATSPCASTSPRAKFQRKSRTVPVQQNAITTSVLSSKGSTKKTDSQTGSYWYTAPNGAQNLAGSDNDKLRKASHTLYDHFDISSSEPVGQVQEVTTKPFNCHHLTNSTERMECVLDYTLGNTADATQEELGAQTSAKTFSCHHLPGSERTECVLQYTQDVGRAASPQSKPAMTRGSEVKPEGSAASGFNCHHLADSARSECVLDYAVEETAQEEPGRQTSAKTFSCHNLSGSERSECVLQYAQDDLGRAVAQQSSPAVTKQSEVKPEGSAASAFNCHHLADSARSECVLDYAVEETAHTTQEELSGQTSAKSFNCHNLSGSARAECVLNF